MPSNPPIGYTPPPGYTIAPPKQPEEPTLWQSTIWPWLKSRFGASGPQIAPNPLPNQPPGVQPGYLASDRLDPGSPLVLPSNFMVNNKPVGGLTPPSPTPATPAVSTGNQQPITAPTPAAPTAAQYSQPHINQQTGLPYYMGGDNLPPPGSAEYNRIQSIIANPARTTFNIPQNNTYGSGSLTPNTQYGVEQTRQGAATNMWNQGTGTPTSDLLSTLLPNYRGALENYADLTNKINTTRLAENQEINNLLSNGAITKEQANAFKTETQRRYDTDLANLTVAQGSAANTVDVYSRLWNTFGKPQEVSPGGALVTPTGQQVFASPRNPIEVSPGSSLVDPLTGQVVTQGTGASPSTIVAYAQDLFQQDSAVGQPHLTADGQVDQQYYTSRAQQILSGVSGGGGFPQAPATAGQPGVTPSTTGGQLPPAVAKYVVSTPEGLSYINADKVSANELNFVKNQAANYGIPLLTNEDVSKYKNIQVTQSNLQDLSTLINKVNQPGIYGRTLGAAGNYLKNIFQTDADISAFNVWRDTAINTIQSLAGGSGSGFRLNQAEIDTATGNLPTIYDNQETAQNKIRLINGFLSKWQSELLTGSPTGLTGGQSPLQTGGGGGNIDWSNLQ